MSHLMSDNGILIAVSVEGTLHMPVGEIPVILVLVHIHVTQIIPVLLIIDIVSAGIAEMLFPQTDVKYRKGLFY